MALVLSALALVIALAAVAAVALWVGSTAVDAALATDRTPPPDFRRH